MKVKLTYPIASMSGSTSAEPNQNHLQWKGIQIIRRTTTKKVPAQGVWDETKTSLQAIAFRWKSMNSQQKTEWKKYSDSLNSTFAQFGKMLNPFICFMRTNLFSCYYRDAVPIFVPPSVVCFQIPRLDTLEAETSPAKTVGITCILPETNYQRWILVKTTEPKNGFQHAFRNSELSCVKDSAYESIIASEQGTPYLGATFYGTHYSYVWKQFCHVALTYFDIYGNVGQTFFYPTQLQYID